MNMIGLLACFVAIILVKIRMKEEKVYKKIIVTLVYTFFFAFTYYFARNATIFLCGDFESGQGHFIWLCLLFGAVLYFPEYRRKEGKKWFSFLLGETGRLLTYIMMTVLGFCAQEIKNLHLPCQVIGILLIAVYMFIAGLRYGYGQRERALDCRDFFTLVLLAGFYYYFGFVICYKNMGNPAPYIYLNIIILFVVLLFILFVSASMNVTVIIGAVINSVWILTHYFVYQFRGTIFVPNDILAAATAATVAGQYEFHINSNIWKMCAFSLLIIMSAINYRKVYVMKGRWVFSITGTLILSLLVMGWYQSDFINNMNLLYKDYQQDRWYDSVGYTLGFVEVMKKNQIERPDNYDENVITELAAGYQDADELAGEGNNPDIVVIMNEAFADIGDVGTIETNIDYMPYYHSLTTDHNTAVGRVLVSVLGGNTCQSEYEFLTGNSIEFAPNTVPYATEINRNIYSLVSTLRSQGYHTIATHPYPAGNWNRDVVYKHMQFDEMYFIEDYENAEYIREQVSDRTIYHKILTWLENDKVETSQFVFAVTIQNHGGYSGVALREGEVLPVMRKGSTETGGVDEYLSLIYESDKALEELIVNVDALERPTIVVMFGDHMPTMTTDFDNAIKRTTVKQNEQDQFERFQIYRATPYIVHANYDVDLSQIPEYLSVNYLGSNVLKACGMKMSAFNRYLLDMEETIPAFNAFGFLTEDGEWYQYSDEYPAVYKEKFEEYNILQYNTRYKDALPQMFAVQ